MVTRTLALAGAAVTLLVSTLILRGEPEIAPPTPPMVPLGLPCQLADPPPVLFLVRESRPEEVDGLRSFVRQWGAGYGCFRGRVVTDLVGSRLDPATVLVLDLGHDEALSAADAASVARFVAGGGRLALFAYPWLAEQTAQDPAATGQLAQILPAVRLSPARGCGDWRYANALARPFPLGGILYRYESFSGLFFTVTTAATHTELASPLLCRGSAGPVSVALGRTVASGFSIAYVVSFADNNPRAVDLKKMIVDVVSQLSRS
jgi:hypothetical protein